MYSLLSSLAQPLPMDTELDLAASVPGSVLGWGEAGLGWEVGLGSESYV